MLNHFKINLPTLCDGVQDSDLKNAYNSSPQKCIYIFFWIHTFHFTRTPLIVTWVESIKLILTASIRLAMKHQRLIAISDWSITCLCLFPLGKDTSLSCPLDVSAWRPISFLYWACMKVCRTYFFRRRIAVHIGHPKDVRKKHPQIL